MNKITLICLLLLFSSVLSAHDGYIRNRDADVLNYQFNISINDSTNRIEAVADIKVKFLAPVSSFTLDLKSSGPDGKGMDVTSAAVNGENTRWEQGKDKLTIFFKHNVSKNDTLNISIIYSGIPADGLIISKNKYGSRTFFADHWPDRAHNYLPCIDHPYDKAEVDFIIKSPDCYKVVASGSLIEESPLAKGRKMTHWKESVPISTKVMTFGAARFSVHSDGTVTCIPVSAWVFPENQREGFSDYSIAVSPLQYYIKTIGEYPYEKLANVQSKTIYGGLENAGTIFYSENSVTGQGKDEGLIAHEEAHQWFGDCVTEADWHHIWLSEGFATYLTSLYFESKDGRKKLESDMSSSRERVLRFYDRNPAPVIDSSVTDLMKLLNPNSYQKGGWVLHMLRNEIGDEAFFRGLRLYYSRFRNSNALTDDFRKVMEESGKKDLSLFFRQWLYVAGQPELKIWQESGKGKDEIEINIEQKQEHLFEFNLELSVVDASGEKSEKVFIKDRVTKLSVKASDNASVIADPHVNLLFRPVP